MPVVAGTAFSLLRECVELVRSLLNDADLTTQANITPTGASRTSNVVTITTSSPHNLAIGNRVTIEGVTDTSFNGTFTVASVPSSTTFTYAQTAANGSSGNGTVTLLIQGDVFTDAALLPLANAGYRRVQRRLAEAGLQSMTAEIELLNLVAGGLRVDDTTTPQLPVDFLAPRELLERTAGTTQKYVPMIGPVGRLPQRAQSTHLVEWDWREDALLFVGSTEARDLLLRYSRALANMVNADSPIQIRGGLDAVAYRTAMLAAASKGAAGPALWNELFEEEIKELKNLDAHVTQSRPARRLPYGGFRRRRG